MTVEHSFFGFFTNYIKMQRFLELRKGLSEQFTPFVNYRGVLFLKLYMGNRPNDAKLRKDVFDCFSDIFRQLRADRVIHSWSVVCDESNNTFVDINERKLNLNLHYAIEASPRYSAFQWSNKDLPLHRSTYDVWCNGCPVITQDTFSLLESCQGQADPTPTDSDYLTINREFSGR